MIHTTFIARITDGLMLCENYDESQESLIDSKRKVKQFLKSQGSNKNLKDADCLEVGEFYSKYTMKPLPYFYVPLAIRRATE